jgi:hypothetical protein
MLEWIECQTPELPSSIITEKTSNVSMRCFMKSNGDDQGITQIEAPYINASICAGIQLTVCQKPQPRGRHCFRLEPSRSRLAHDERFIVE